MKIQIDCKNGIFNENFLLTGNEAGKKILGSLLESSETMKENTKGEVDKDLHEQEGKKSRTQKEYQIMTMKQDNSADVQEPRPEVSPPKILKKRGRKPTSKLGTPKKATSIDLSFIERFATVWRCKICQKISSNKFMALDHREEAHAVAMQLK